MNNKEDQELLDLQRRLQKQHGIQPQEPEMPRLGEILIDMVAANAAAKAETETEYLADDGLLHCKICGGKRQTIITPPFEGALPRTVRCWCHCPTEYDRLKEREKLIQMEQRRSVCFRGTEELARCTFDQDDGTGHPELIAAAKRYVEQFPDRTKDGMGLLFYGPVGTGKTFLAGCIANAVIAKGYKVKLANFSTLADEIWSALDKAAYIADLASYPLLILDDLGAERKTEYMMEMVYKVINARYVAGLPVIVTTNLTPDELTKAADVTAARTYDRLIEKCLPVKVDGKSRRRAAAADTLGAMRRQLGLEGA